MKAKERRTVQILDQLDAGRSNQALLKFNRMKAKELSQAVELALEHGIDNESLRHSLKTHHLSKHGDMPMKVIHAILMKQPDDFDYYDSLRTPIMQKLARDPAMLENYLQYAQNATHGWEDTAFKEVVKTAPNGEDIFGFIGIVTYEGTRKVTPHVVFDADRETAHEKTMLTVLHNIMDKNLKDTTPANDEDGYDVIRVHHDGNISYLKTHNVKDAAATLNTIVEDFGLAVSNSKFRPAVAKGNVTYTFDISTAAYDGDPEALQETFKRTACSRPKARRAAALAALDSRLIFEISGVTVLPQTAQTRAKVCAPAA